MFDFTVVVLEGAYAASVAATVDILAAASRLAPRCAATAPRWRVCSAGGGPVRLSSGLTIATSRLAARPARDLSTWLIPGLGVDRAPELERRLCAADAVRVARAVGAHVRAGGAVAASCSAVFLLRSAGVLRGRRVTTSWWLAPDLARSAPGSRVDADRMVCADGPILTGGAAFGQTDLVLYALRRHGGSALADWVSRMLLIDGRVAQAPYVVPEAWASGGDLVGRIVSRVEAALPRALSVARLARELGMSSRTLSRQVHRATGRSTKALVQSVKLRKARALLESSRMTIEQVAAAVGYRDSSALRRMMKRVAGSGPARWRS